MIELVLAPSVEDLIAAENRKAEIQVNWVSALLITTVLLVVMPTVYFTHGGHPPLAFYWDVGILLFGLAGCGVIAGLIRAACYDQVLPYAAALLEYGLLGAILLNHSLNHLKTVGELSLVAFDPVLYFAFLLNGYAAVRFNRKAALFCGGLSLILTGGAIALDHRHGNLINPVSIGLLFILALASIGVAQLIIAKSRQLIDQAVAHQHEKDRVQTVLSRYVSPQVAQTVLQDGQMPAAGQRMRVTVLFADIRGFTQMSERMLPEEVVSFLNTYLSRMVDAIFAHGGTLDKYMGDGIMAFFGAPVEVPDHAERAVKAALAMREALAAFNDERVRHGEDPIAIGIGLHTGECVVGNIGTSLRLDYTAVGDVVNTASRLEGLTKRYEVDVLMSQETYQEVSGWVDTRAIACVGLRGKNSKMDVYVLEGARRVVPADASALQQV
jgi:class 3 adenylate cyclase